MTDIIAEVIADSIGEHSPRLLTLRTRAPKFIHQETLRHRRIYVGDNLALTYDPDFSFSVSSSRAVPFKKMAEEVRWPNSQARPLYWGEAQKGMSPGKELDDVEKCVCWSEILDKLSIKFGDPFPNDPEMITKRECAIRLWHLGATYAAIFAEAMVEHTDVHKSTPNRMVETYVHVNALMTGTESGWMNFFGLRLDRAADPTLRALAERCWLAWNESQPRKLTPGEWHLPYANDHQSANEAVEFLCMEETRKLLINGSGIFSNGIEILKKMSVARCAHLSYESFETGQRMTVERCLELYQKLVGSVPLHASPAEHQATPDETIDHQVTIEVPQDDLQGQIDRDGRLLRSSWTYHWSHPELAGNLGPGWVQLRKTLANEAVAQLPEAYRR